MVTFYLSKNENRTKESPTQLSYIASSKGTTFTKRCILPMREITYANVYLHTKFPVSSIILTSFRQGVISPPQLKTNS